jgi:hypothetical protein
MGYWQIQIDGSLYLAHRLVWFYVHSRWPTHEIDHVNGIKTDNRIGNLRLATKSQNQANSRKRRGCSSKFKGACFCKRSRKWHAHITKNYKTHHLGTFPTAQEAHAAYAVAARKFHGKFAKPE